ncbi:MAG TPA: hypothetical protein PKZ32_14700 [Candidatus Melainabacteria bacterium]|nr:hypothetical protein [Candidatus Melainabacteria bacterium]
MAFEDSKPSQAKNLQAFELSSLNGSAEPAGEREPSAIEIAAQWTPGENQVIRAAGTGTDPDKPYAKDVEALFGSESRYVRESPAGLREGLNLRLKELEMQTGKKLGSVRTSDSYETVQDKTAALMVAGFGPGSQWSDEFKAEVMKTLQAGNPGIKPADMSNQATVREALNARDRKQAATVLGESAASRASGATLERAVNQYHYRHMQKYGIETDPN